MTAESKEAPVDQRLIKALGHPVRMRALEVLNARVASPSELAKELHEPLGNVAYHVKILEAYDEMADLLSSVVNRARELHAEAAPRLAGSSASERHGTALMIMHVHRAPEGDGA